jgi:MFS family permease
VIRLAVTSASGETTNLLPASVSALTCHQPIALRPECFRLHAKHYAPGPGRPRLDVVRTYTEVFRAPEFTALFASSSAQVAASTISGLAVGTYVYAATSSPLLSALAMFGPSLAQLAGATALLSAADRLPPRAAMAWIALAYGLGTLAEAIPGLPVWAIFAIALVLGVLSSLGGGVRYGLLTEILPAGGFLLGRSVLNMSVGFFQVCGFAAGGVLVTFLSPRGTLVAGAALYVLAAAVTRYGLRRRAPRVAGRPSVAATWRANRLLWSSAPRRYVLLALWVPNGLIVGCEALFVSYSPRHAGLMYACAALGMLAGDTLAGRFVPPGGASGSAPGCGCCWAFPTWPSSPARRCRSRRPSPAWPRSATRRACCCRSGSWR